MKFTAIWILMLSLCSFNAVSAMRCGRKLVLLGDLRSEVIARCGEPDSIETRTKIVGSTLHHPRRTLDIQQYEEIEVEDWIYNFGPTRLQYYLRLENGEVKEIESLGRGH